MANEIENVIRTLTSSLKAGVCSNVSITTDADFTELASLPGLLLFYPTLEDYRPNEMNERRITLGADQKTTTIRPPKVFKTLRFEVQILGDKLLGAGGVMQLQTNFIVWLQRNAEIEVDGIDYDVQGTEPQRPLYAANLSNIKRLDGVLFVQGVEIDSGDQTSGTAVQERKYSMQDKEGGTT